MLIGGHISTGRGQAPWTSPEHRALYFADTTGVIHVEGVLIDDIDSGQGDGIAIAAPTAILQIQNVRITGLSGMERGNHADVVQTWGAGDAPDPVQNCLSVLSSDGSELSFPELPRVSGVVRKAPPPGGDFVPEGVAGPDYVSLGYVR